jgi:preprotein translocase subunit SecG
MNMSWLQTLAVVFHVLLAAGIVGLVLLQRGRGADAGAGFGAGASGTVFGARGSASFLSRTTAVLATLFFVSSLVLSYLFSHAVAPTSVMDRVATEQPAPVGSAPPGAGAPAAAPAPITPPSTPGQTAPAPVTQGAPATPAPAPAGQ